MIREIDIVVLPQQAASEEHLLETLAREKGVERNRVQGVRILKRSVDARQRTVRINLRVRLYLDEPMEEEPLLQPDYRDVSDCPAVVVVGAGPAGLFAALRLIELGRRPIVLERGRNVRDRKRDIARISRDGTVDPESNYSFGEGGAGAYSDGKLHTRSKKRGSVDRILQLLCLYGADRAIRVDAHPHIGTDRLPRIIENIRERIRACGGEVHFETRVTRLLFGRNGVTGAETADGREFRGPVILATGHSARDVYRMLQKSDVRLEAKGIAVGVRLEHPQERIDRIQYHTPEGRGTWLPAAEYSFTAQVRDRGVYSFCMCPGGFVVPAASGPEQIVVNGMSPANRGSRWANAGMVVEVRPEELPGFRSDDPLTVLRFQEELERTCFHHGEGLRAPAQRMEDFVKGRLSADLPATSYVPGICTSPLHRWMPPAIASRLQEGFVRFGNAARGFLTNEATLIGVESRTSAPVRIPRDPETLQHLQVPGLYPCGEGAGYAGGIVSAAIDGERCAEAAAARCF